MYTATHQGKAGISQHSSQTDQMSGAEMTNLHYFLTVWSNIYMFMFLMQW